MFKLRNMPGVGWLVIGVCLTALVMPSVAFAAGALKFTGIEGTSTNKADVSSANQLLTASASPSHYFATADVGLTATAQAIAIPPSGDGLVVTSVELATYSDPSPAADYVNLSIGNSTCTTFVGPYQHGATPSGIGETIIPFDPGLAIPSGDALCAAGLGLGVYVAVIGYTAPAADIPIAAAPNRAAPALLPRQP